MPLTCALSLAELTGLKTWQGTYQSTQQTNKQQSTSCSYQVPAIVRMRMTLTMATTSTKSKHRPGYGKSPPQQTFIIPDNEFPFDVINYRLRSTCAHLPAYPHSRTGKEYEWHSPEIILKCHVKASPTSAEYLHIPKSVCLEPEKEGWMEWRPSMWTSATVTATDIIIITQNKNKRKLMFC